MTLAWQYAPSSMMLSTAVTFITAPVSKQHTVQTQVEQVPQHMELNRPSGYDKQWHGHQCCRQQLLDGLTVALRFIVC